MIPEASPVPEGIPLADSSSSHQATEAESDSGLPEEGFDAFDQARSSADPVGDLGDLDLSEADFLLAGTASQAEMGLKRRPPTSLFDLIEGQSGKEAPGKSQSKPPPPSPQPQPVQTMSSPARSRTPSPRPKHPASPQSTLPPRPEPTDSKRKRSFKGKEPMDEGKSHTPQEEGEAPRVQKQLKIGPQGQGKEIDAQSAPEAWLPAPMLHREPLMENASLRDFRGGEGAYVADALERALLLPTDMKKLKNTRSQEVFLSMKRYLAMVRLLILVTPSIFVPQFPIHSVLVPIGRPSRPLIGWRMRLRSRASPSRPNVISVWMLLAPLRTLRLISLRPGRI